MPQLKYKLENLLNETAESYYWLGFLLADGHFSKLNRLSVVLSIKDRDHLVKFLNFLNSDANILEFENSPFRGINQDIKYMAAHLAIMDTYSISVLREKYNIVSNKTENPPNLSSLTDEQKFCLKIGFIDGDGSIQYQSGRKDCIMSIKCHHSWKDTIEFLFGKCSINNKGYAYHCTADNEVLRAWKRKAIELNLPFMERKWNKIDTSKVSRYKIAEDWQTVAINLLSFGYSINEICFELDKKYSTVYQALYRKNLTRKEVWS